MADEKEKKERDEQAKRDSVTINMQQATNTQQNAAQHQSSHTSSSEIIVIILTIILLIVLLYFLLAFFKIFESLGKFFKIN